MLLLVDGGVSNVAWLPPSLLPWEVAGVIQTDGPGGLVSSYFITPSVAIQTYIVKTKQGHFLGVSYEHIR